MGGVLARLLVSTSDDELWTTFQNKYVPEGADLDREDERLNRLLSFTPMPQVERAIFIAAPHRGTPFASNRIARWAANLVRLPLALLHEFEDVMQSATNIDSGDKERQTLQVPNSIEQLRESDPLIQATAQLPISPQGLLSLDYRETQGDRSARGFRRWGRAISQRASCWRTL